MLLLSLTLCYIMLACFCLEKKAFRCCLLQAKEVLLCRMVKPQTGAGFEHLFLALAFFVWHFPCERLIATL